MPRRLGFLDSERGRDIVTTRELDAPSPSGSPAWPPPLDGGPRIAPRGQDAREANLSRLIFPPRLEKLASSKDFNVTDYAMTLAAGAGSFITSAALRFTLPASQVGWLQECSLYFLTPTAATTVRFTVRINEGPVPGFDNLQIPPGIANFVLMPIDSMRIRVPDGATVDMLITNLGAGGPWTVGGSLSGWYHPDIAEQRAWNLDL